LEVTQCEGYFCSVCSLPQAPPVQRRGRYCSSTLRVLV